MTSRHVLFSMTNKSRKGRERHLTLGILDLDTSKVSWVRAGTSKRDFGVSGIFLDGGILYIAVQARAGRSRILTMDTHTWEVLGTYHLQHVSDPHSFCVHDDELYIVSSGNNGIFKLDRSGVVISGETLIWQFPGTANEHDEVHLNSITSVNNSICVTAFGHRNENGRFGETGIVLDIFSGDVFLENLKHPHSVTAHGDRLYVADSGHSSLAIGTATETGYDFRHFDLRGYVRGVLPLDGTVLVGISAYRKTSRSGNNTVEQRNEGHEHCEILEFDPTTNAIVKTVDLTRFGQEVYDIMALPELGPKRPPSPYSNKHVENAYLYFSNLLGPTRRPRKPHT